MIIEHIYKHIVRAPGKTLLSIAAALVFTLTLGMLQLNIANLEREIGQIHSETAVNAEIRLCPNFRGDRFRRLLGDIVPMAVARNILNLEIAEEVYLEGGASALLLPLSDTPLAILDAPEGFGRQDILVGISELRHLTEAPAGFLGRDSSFNMEIQFAPDFDEANFLHPATEAIPLILSQELAERRGVAPGETIHIVYYRPILFRTGDWLYTTALILGVHNGEGLPNHLRDGAVVPLEVLEALYGDSVGFHTFRFTIDPAYNHDLSAAREGIEAYLARPVYPWREHLMLDIQDQELRFALAALQQHVMLLELLLPIAIGVSAVIALGLTLLLTLQNAKIAAIMRVLGMSKRKLQVVLWSWQMLLCISGGALGFLLATALGLRGNFVPVALPYLAGAVLGATVGACLITSRAPLDLLQVKE